MSQFGSGNLEYRNFILSSLLYIKNGLTRLLTDTDDQNIKWGIIKLTPFFKGVKNQMGCSFFNGDNSLNLKEM